MAAIRCCDCEAERHACAGCRAVARSRNPLPCPGCAGRGGSRDYWGEWAECYLCRGRGKTTRRQISADRLSVRALDRRIDALARFEGWKP